MRLNPFFNLLRLPHTLLPRTEHAFDALSGSSIRIDNANPRRPRSSFSLRAGGETFALVVKPASHDELGLEVRTGQRVAKKENLRSDTQRLHTGAPD
jgi:hypothetical protein